MSQLCLSPVYVWALLSFLHSEVECNLEADLHRNLMKHYNKNIRPMENNGDITEVKLKMTLTNLISLNEKEETLTTCVWIEMVSRQVMTEVPSGTVDKAAHRFRHMFSQPGVFISVFHCMDELNVEQWHDYRLRWANRPGFEAYENITRTRIPSKSIWLPDIILENNVDGHFEIALYTNTLVDPEGMIYWLPPAIYRSACAITVNYFPFDWQNCSMIFRSQAYSANEIELKLTEEENTTVEWIEIDPEAFTENGEWIIKHRPAKKVINEHYGRDELEYQEIIFFLIIQRKPLFYIINIIVPCVLLSSLGLLVYFLPAKAGGQKCHMSISILLAQTVFLFLVAKKVPETSKAVPLIGKYLMFVMSVTTITVMNCVVVLNVSLRTPNTHPMTDKVRKVLLNILPGLLRMRMQRWTPQKGVNGTANGSTLRRRSSLGLIVKADEYMLRTARTELMFNRLKERNGLMRTALEKIHSSLGGDAVQDLSSSLAEASPELQQCVTSCKHIAESIKQHDDFQSENEEWFLVARVIDRLCFITMAMLFVFGTIGIFLMGHFNQAPSEPFPGDPKKYLPETFPVNNTG